jgi:hypothetical protein
MWKNGRVCVSVAVLALGLAATVRSAQADLPQYCQDLMNQYATDPGRLDASALAVLQDCQAAAGQAPPQAQPTENPSPGATPIDQPGWGKWSPSAPWSDEKAKSGSWGDHVSE